MNKFHYQNPNGILEVYDSKTGNLLEVHGPGSLPFSNSVKDSLVEYKLPDGRLLLAATSIPMETIEAYYGLQGSFNPVLGDILCQYITEGLSLTKACEKLSVPYSRVCKWKRQSEEFARLLEEAKADRAEMLRDELIELADSVLEDSDHVAKVRAQIDARKWAAGSDDPKTYSGKAKVDSVAGGAVTIVINTGISREERDVAPLVPTVVSPLTVGSTHNGEE